LKGSRETETAADNDARAELFLELFDVLAEIERLRKLSESGWENR
jgi:hypothetical protein